MGENRYSGWDNKKDSSLTHAFRVYKEMNQKQKTIVIVILIAFILIDIKIFSSIAGRFGEDKDNKAKYKEAIACYEEAIESYDMELLDEANQMFLDLNYYEDSHEYITNIENEKNNLTIYNEAMALWQEEKYVEAFDKFEMIIDYRDSLTNINSMAATLYADAEAMIEEERYDTASNILLRIPESSTEYYALAQEMYNSMSDIKSVKNKEKKYESAMTYYNAGNYEDAQPLFIDVRKQYDVSIQLDTIANYYYGIGESCYANGDYDGFFNAMDKIDSEREWTEYEKVIAYIEQVKGEYKTLVTENASSILLTQGYGAFKEYVNDSINLGFSQGDANTLLNDKKPVMLSTLSPYDSWEFKENEEIMDLGWSSRELQFDYGIRDVAGNQHSDVMMGGGCAAAYYIGDSDYSMLTGSVFIVEGCNATVDKPVQLLIRNDEGVTLYRCELLSGYSTEYFAIDVSGEDKILIYFNGFEGHTLSEDDWYGGVGEFCFIK